MSVLTSSWSGVHIKVTDECLYRTVTTDIKLLNEGKMVKLESAWVGRLFELQSYTTAERLWS